VQRRLTVLVLQSTASNTQVFSTHHTVD
jgi:hypothetical protein